MPVIGSVLGWSAFGLAARFWQLAILKRNMFENLGGHALSMGAFGAFGYAYYHGDQRVAELLEQKKESLRQQKAARLAGSAGDSEGGDEE